MQHTAQIIYLLFLMFTQADASAAPSELSSFKWSNRVVVVNEIAKVDAILALFEENKSRINDRDIIWLVFKGNRTFTNFSGSLPNSLIDSVKNRYKMGIGTVILIGKDGGLKASFDHLDLETIFSKIDAMPMRQGEMRE